MPRHHRPSAVPAGLVLLAALATPAFAQDARTGAAKPSAICPDLPDLGGTLRRARVVAEGRVAFVRSADADPACPSLAPACREKAFLVAGNGVIRGASSGAFACANYVGATGQIRSGWLPERVLADDAPATVGLDDWIGTWMSGPEQTVTIRRKGERLVLSGTASYGTQDPERVKRGAINMGSFEAELAPDSQDIAWTDGDKAVVPGFRPDEVSRCSVRMRLMPPDLVAESNGACGGMNVTLSGVYRRGG